MTIKIAAFTLYGAILANKVANALRNNGYDATAYAAPRIADVAQLESTEGIQTWTERWFPQADALVYIGAAGIAVRAVAPFVKSKLTDPAVLSMDEKGRYVVSLLSGHIGGANQLARRIADFTGGVAVISTATDVNGKFAVDDWAARNGYVLRNPKAIRGIANALLEEKTVGFSSEYPVEDGLPLGMITSTDTECGLYIGIHPSSPFIETLMCIPPIVTLGLGCRRGVSEETICAALQFALAKANIAKESIGAIASIDLKRNEAGLLRFAERMRLETVFYNAEELQSVEGHFTPSERVLAVTGVDNVCERAAVLRSKGSLILAKTAYNGVTIALAIQPFTVRFKELNG